LTGGRPCWNWMAGNPYRHQSQRYTANTV